MSKLYSLMQGAVSNASASPTSLSLNVVVRGLGPAFKLTLELFNKGSEPVADAALVSSTTEASTLPDSMPLVKLVFAETEVTQKVQ